MTPATTNDTKGTSDVGAAGDTREPDVDELLLGFARALRAAGVNVTADRERTFLVAAATVGMGERLVGEIARAAQGGRDVVGTGEQVIHSLSITHRRGLGKRKCV